MQPAVAAGDQPGGGAGAGPDRHSAVRLAGGGCCGALTHHLSAHAESLAQMRRNVDALWPHVEAGAEAVVFTASACAAMVCDYGRLLRMTPPTPRVPRASARSRGTSASCSPPRPTRCGAALADARTAARAGAPRVRVPGAVHPAARAARNGVVEPLLIAAGFTLTPVTDGGAAAARPGTYSLLQPELATRLLRAKVSALEADAPQLIATANIGCLVHLRSGTALPVHHWIELLAARLDGG